MLGKFNSQTWLDAYLVKVATALAYTAIANSTLEEEINYLTLYCCIAYVRSNSEGSSIANRRNLANFALLDTYLDTGIPLVVELVTNLWDELVSCLAVFITNLIARDTSCTTDVNLLLAQTDLYHQYQNMCYLNAVHSQHLHYQF